MTIATDRVEILMDIIEAGMPLVVIPGLRVHCLESDWNTIPNDSRKTLHALRQRNIIRFIDLDSLFYSQVACLFGKYGAGIAMSNYYILSFCLMNSVPLLTTDLTISKVGRSEKVKMKKAKSLHLDFLVKSVELQGPQKLKEVITKYERKKEYDVDKKRGDQLAS